MVHWWALLRSLEWMRSCNSCKLLNLLVQYFNLETILQGAPSWLLIPVSVFTCIVLVRLATGFPLVSWLWTTFPGWKSKFNSVVLEIHPRVSQGPDHFGRLHLKWFKSSTTLGPMKFPCIFQACDWTNMCDILWSQVYHIFIDDYRQQQLTVISDSRVPCQPSLEVN
jgi:hypothetical protein